MQGSACKSPLFYDYMLSKHDSTPTAFGPGGVGIFESKSIMRGVARLSAATYQDTNHFDRLITHEHFRPDLASYVEKLLSRAAA
ncbi:hypothetical protein ACVW16_000240 [Bradyrhizobium sp. USDA 4474]